MIAVSQILDEGILSRAKGASLGTPACMYSVNGLRDRLMLPILSETSAETSAR